jgi:maleylacetate reductase
VQQHTSLGTKRVRFGQGIRQSAADEMRLLGVSRALVLSTPNQKNVALEIAEGLSSSAVGVFCKAAMHTPVDITEVALRLLHQLDADCVIAIGGGSTTGLGKALAYRTGVLQIVIPTTYAGSEATSILGQTENGLKTTLTDPRILPDVVLYDAELLTSLPIKMTVTSALNAIAHAAEALYAPNRTSDTDALAVEGLRTFINALPRVITTPLDVDIRTETQRGTWACGTVLGHVGMGLHHKLCHTLGGTFNLPHAETHAVILPHAIAYNQRSAAAELKPIGDLLKSNNAGLALYEFAASLNAPMSLAELGLQETDLDRAADIATQKPYPNPHPITRKDIRKLLQAAWAGTSPVFQ